MEVKVGIRNRGDGMTLLTLDTASHPVLFPSVESFGTRTKIFYSKTVMRLD